MHFGMSTSDYKDWEANRGIMRGDKDWTLSRSELMDMLECGEFFLGGGEQKESKSLGLGDLVDCMLLTPEEFDARFVVHPPTYRTTAVEKKWTKRAKYCKDWEAANPGMEPPATYPSGGEERAWNRNADVCQAWEAEQTEKGLEALHQKQVDEAQEIVDAIMEKSVDGHPLKSLIALAEKQVVVTADWHEGGAVIPVRAMLDLAIIEIGYDAWVLDLKTAKSAAERQLGFSMRDYHYDVQSWLYPQMLACALKDGATLRGANQPIPFGLIVVRNTKPYLVATYVAKAATRADGEEKFRRAMSAYVAALSGGFKGYTERWEEI